MLRGVALLGIAVELLVTTCNLQVCSQLYLRCDTGEAPFGGGGKS